MNNNYVSPCCGEDYEAATNSYCCGAQISDSGLCYECREHTESEGYECDECEEWFDELIELNEYKELKKENNEEERADAKRKYDE